VSSGGYASGTTVTAGGSETVAGTETYPGAGGAFGVQSGGVQIVLAGGVVSADTVGAGGVQIVSSGGTVINPTSGTPIRGTQIFWVGANVTEFVSAGAHLEEAGLTVSSGVSVALKPFTSLTALASERAARPRISQTC
jgi:autotransporter passenger strand-loop-strand repeat protein